MKVSNTEAGLKKIVAYKQKRAQLLLHCLEMSLYEFIPGRFAS